MGQVHGRARMTLWQETKNIGQICKRKWREAHGWANVRSKDLNLPTILILYRLKCQPNEKLRYSLLLLTDFIAYYSHNSGSLAFMLSEDLQKWNDLMIVYDNRDALFLVCWKLTLQAKGGSKITHLKINKIGNKCWRFELENSSECGYMLKSQANEHTNPTWLWKRRRKMTQCFHP